MPSKERASERVAGLTWRVSDCSSYIAISTDPVRSGGLYVEITMIHEMMHAVDVAYGRTFDWQSASLHGLELDAPEDAKEAAIQSELGYELRAQAAGMLAWMELGHSFDDALLFSYGDDFFRYMPYSRRVRAFGGAIDQIQMELGR